MNHFKNFKGFAIQQGFSYESSCSESPIETACRILERYIGKQVELGCEIYPGGMRREVLTILDSDSIRESFDGIDSSLCDYLYLDIFGGSMYVIQRLVIGNQSVSQVERA